jgi:hypothetical protein
MKNYIDKDLLLSGIEAMGLQNECTNRYGDGFEDAITLAIKLINSMPIHTSDKPLITNIEVGKAIMELSGIANKEHER